MRNIKFIYFKFFPTDGLVKKLEELEKVADMYKGLIDHTKLLLKTTFELSQSHKGKILFTFIFLLKSVQRLLYM